MADKFTSEQEIAKLSEWCCGDINAVNFLVLLGKLSQLADDVADGDISASPENIVKILHIAMVDVPLNGFYQKHSQLLLPLFSTSLMFWGNSDKWGKGDRVEYGFVYREILEQVVTMTATIIGGVNHGYRVTEDLVDFFHEGKDIGDWQKEQSA